MYNERAAVGLSWEKGVARRVCVSRKTNVLAKDVGFGCLCLSVCICVGVLIYVRSRILHARFLTFAAQVIAARCSTVTFTCYYYNGCGRIREMLIVFCESSGLMTGDGN